MQNLVEAQGEQIDSLEAYLDSTVGYTEAATGFMAAAVESQKNIRRVSAWPLLRGLF